MSRSRLWLGVMLVVVVALSACGAPSRAPIKLSAQDAGRTVELNKGDQLQVTLEGNPGTGYQWERVGGDEAILASAAEPEFRAAGDALGAPAQVSLRFQAGEPGQTALRLIYHRSFEPDVPPEATFEVTVVVK